MRTTWDIARREFQPVRRGTGGVEYTELLRRGDWAQTILDEGRNREIFDQLFSSSSVMDVERGCR